MGFANRRDCVMFYAIMFFVGSFVGWVYETIGNFFVFGGLWLREWLILPWCPIYGIGAVIICALFEALRGRLSRLTTSTCQQVLIVSFGLFVVVTGIELTGSYVCEAFMCKVPWDYSDAWLNFEGRVAIKYSLRFVAFGLLAIYVVSPWAKSVVEHHRMTCERALTVLVALMVLDVLGESMGFGDMVRGLLVPFGIHHW